MDTSGSMNDEFVALCSKLSDVINRLVNEHGIDLDYRLWGIDNIRDCLTSYVSAQYPSGIVNNIEDWGGLTRQEPPDNLFPAQAANSQELIP